MLFFLGAVRFFSLFRTTCTEVSQFPAWSIPRSPKCRKYFKTTSQKAPMRIPNLTQSRWGGATCATLGAFGDPESSKELPRWQKAVKHCRNVAKI